MGINNLRSSIILTDKFSATFRKFNAQLAKSDKGLDNLGSALSGGGLGALFGGVAGVAGAAALANVTWEMGRLGATVITTTDSFERMTMQAGLSAGFLSDMKSAAGGTITELELMQGVNTALAGTSGELSSALGQALPSLLEIARAANKANPALGTTQHMFESLVTGIRRGSPMLIDNLGLTVKIGEANEQYARKLGKTAQELTATEKQMALLNATMDAGDVLIEQVGGSLDSIADDFMAAEVAVKELKSAFAELSAPTIANVAGEIATGLQRINAEIDNDKLAALNAELKQNQMLLDEVNRSIEKNGSNRTAERQVRDLTSNIANLNDAIKAEEDFLDRASSAAIRLANAQGKAVSSASSMAVSVRKTGDAVKYTTAEMRGFNQQIDSWLAGVRAAGSAVSDLTALSSGLSSAESIILGGADLFEAEMGVRLYQETADALAALDAAYPDAAKRGIEYQIAQAQILSGLSEQVDGFRDLSKSIDKASSSMSGLIAQQIHPDAFDLSGLTGGALQDFGMKGADDPEGPFKHLRRLAAIALRPDEEMAKHEIDWADTFDLAGLTGKTGEALALGAQEALQQFEMGQNFELIDWDVVKQNINFSQGLEDAVKAAADGASVKMGHAIGTSINSGVDSNSKLLVKAGETGAGYLLGGMTEAVQDGAPGVFDALVEAIAPGVMGYVRAYMNRHGQVQ